MVSDSAACDLRTSEFSVVISYLNRTPDGYEEVKHVRDLELKGRPFSRLVREYESLEKSYIGKKISHLYFFAVPRRVGFDHERAKAVIRAKMDSMESERLESLEMMAAADDMSYNVKEKLGNRTVIRTVYPRPYDKIMSDLTEKVRFSESAQILLSRLLESINPQMEIVGFSNRKSEPHGI